MSGNRDFSSKVNTWKVSWHYKNLSRRNVFGEILWPYLYAWIHAEQAKSYYEIPQDLWKRSIPYISFWYAKLYEHSISRKNIFSKNLLLVQNEKVLKNYFAWHGVMSRDSAVLRLVDNCLDATSLTPKKARQWNKITKVWRGVGVVFQFPLWTFCFLRYMWTKQCTFTKVIINTH